MFARLRVGSLAGTDWHHNVYTKEPHSGEPGRDL